MVGRRVIGDRWGATEAEIRRRYPCDDFVPDPTLQAWRAVTVRAAPRLVWPWVTQIRLAPYSYDMLDNLGRRSPQQLCDLPDPQVGEPFTAVLRGRPAGHVLAVVPGEHLTARIMGAVMSYVLDPSGPDTRLLLKVVSRGGKVLTPALALGDLVMARRQLLNLARLAEQGAAAS